LAPCDYDRDGDIDQTELGTFRLCVGASSLAANDPLCSKADLNIDGKVDASDLDLFKTCTSGATVPADPKCMD